VVDFNFTLSRLQPHWLPGSKILLNTLIVQAIMDLLIAFQAPFMVGPETGSGGVGTAALSWCRAKGARLRPPEFRLLLRMIFYSQCF
jgi:hypothetical protein